MLNRALFNQVLFNGRIAGAIALAGSIVVSSAVSATVEKFALLTGSSYASTATQASLNKSDNLAAAILAEATSSSAIYLNTSLESDVSTHSTIECAPVVDTPLDGLSDLGGLAVTGILSGSLEGITPLSSQLQCSSSASQSGVVLLKNIRSAVAVSSSAQGGLVLESVLSAEVNALALSQADTHISVNFSAESVATTDAAASLDLLLPIAATGNANVTASGIVKISKALSATVASVTSASNSTFNKESPLNAATSVLSLLAGSPVLDISIGGSSSCIALTAAEVGLGVNLATIAELTSLASGGLQISSFLGSAVLGPVSVSADAYIQKPVTANAQITTTTDAALLKEIPLDATLDASVTVADGDLEKLAKLSATINTQLSAAGNIKISADLGVAILGPIAATAALDITKNIAANSVSTSATSAEIDLTVSLGGELASSQQVSADLSVYLLIYYGKISAVVETRQVVAAVEIQNGLQSAAKFTIQNGVQVQARNVVAEVSIQNGLQVVAKVVIQNGVQAKVEINNIDTSEISYLKVA